MKFICDKAPSNIYEAFYPISWVYSWHSFFPFTFIGDPKDGNLKTTGRNIFIFFFWVILTTLCLFVNLTSFSYDSFEVSTKLMQSADQFNVILGLCSTLFVILYQMMKKENIKKFLLIMHKFDEKVILFLLESQYYNISFILGKTIENSDKL